MLVDFIALFGAVIIAVTAFAIITALADKPVKALLVALMSSYLMFFVFIYLLNRVLNRIAKRPQE